MFFPIIYGVLSGKGSQEPLLYPLQFDATDGYFTPIPPEVQTEYVNDDGFINVSYANTAPSTLDSFGSVGATYSSSTVYDASEIVDSSIIEFTFNNLSINIVNDEPIIAYVYFPFAASTVGAAGLAFQIQRSTQGAPYVYTLQYNDSGSIATEDVSPVETSDVFALQHNKATGEMILYRNGVEILRSNVDVNNYENLFEQMAALVFFSNTNNFSIDLSANIDFDIIQDPSLFSYSYPNQTVWDFYPKVFLWNNTTSLDTPTGSFPSIYDAIFKDDKIYASMKINDTLSSVVRNASDQWSIIDTPESAALGYTIAVRADNTLAYFGDDIVQINETTNALESTFGGSAPTIGLKEMSTLYTANPILALGRNAAAQTLILRHDAAYANWFVSRMEAGNEIQKHSFALLPGNNSGTAMHEIFTVGNKHVIIPSIILSQDNFNIVSSNDDGDTWAYATCSNSNTVDTSSSANYLDFRRLYIDPLGDMLIHATNNSANFVIKSTDAINWTVYPVPVVLGNSYDSIVGSVMIGSKIAFFREDYAELQWADSSDLSTWNLVPLDNVPSSTLSRETIADNDTMYAYERLSTIQDGQILIYKLPSTALNSFGTTASWSLDASVQCSDSSSRFGDAFQIKDDQGNIIPGFERSGAYIRVAGSWVVPDSYYLSYAVAGSETMFFHSSSMFGPGVTQNTKITRCTPNYLTFLEYSDTAPGSVNEIDPAFNTYFNDGTTAHAVISNEDYYFTTVSNTDLIENANVNSVIGLKIDSGNNVSAIVANTEYTGSRFRINDVVVLQNGSYYLVGGGLNRISGGGLGTIGQVCYYDSQADTHTFINIPDSASFYATIEFDGHIYAGGKPDNTNDQNIIWRTPIGLNDWVVVNSDASSVFHELFDFATDGTTLWALTGFGILSTTDGTTWTVEANENDVNIDFKFDTCKLVSDTTNNKLYALSADHNDEKVYIIERSL